jgi:membrane-associated phospholipid phosphatase
VTELRVFCAPAASNLDGMQVAPAPVDAPSTTGASVPEREHRLFWWKEALIAGCFYAVYSWTRNQFGSNRIASDGVAVHAFHNAERVIRWERFVGLFHEESMQDWFLSQTWLIQAMNTFYGTAHFVITLAVFVLLFFKRKAVFPQWRNTLAAMTALAILGFALFPLMPPRLLDESCSDYGGACVESNLRSDAGSFGFVDTLAEYGGPWSFDTEGMADISNQYAAMPSLHIGWATWSAIAMWPLLRRWWLRAAVLAYPLLTAIVIVVTGNHYWLDAVGGLVIFAVGSIIGWGIHRWNQDRLDRGWARRHAVEAGTGAVSATA